MYVKGYESRQNVESSTFIKISDYFEFIFDDPTKFLKSKVQSHIKLNTLNLLLEFYENQEAFEKCHHLILLKNQINI
jgi:hypothetical protein